MKYYLIREASTVEKKKAKHNVIFVCVFFSVQTKRKHAITLGRWKTAINSGTRA